MIRAVTVVNRADGEDVKSTRLVLENPWETGINITGISGIGPMKATINTTENAAVDGSTFNSARLGTRNIVLSLALLGIDIEAVRHKSYQIFPPKETVRLEFESDHRKCEIYGFIESNEPNIFSKGVTSSVSVICPNPYFYKLRNDGAPGRVSFSNVIPRFEFPFSNESLTDPLLLMGDIENRNQQVVNYPGEVPYGATFRMRAIGPVGNITLYNGTTRQSVYFDTGIIGQMTGREFGAGDELIFNTQPGQKSLGLIRDTQYYNVVNALGRYTDWLYLAKGDNILAFDAASGGINLQVTVEYDVLYLGA